MALAMAEPPATLKTTDISGPDADRPKEMVGRRAAHVQDTRRALLDAARVLFTENGFGGTRTEEVVQRAGLTRGALYHHFRDKEDLFRAVHDEVADEVAQLLWRRSNERNVGGWALFRVNSAIYLDAASSNPAYRQVCLVDGPAVLGWRTWSERSDGPTQQIVRYLIDAVAEGILPPQPVEPLAHLLAALGVGSAMYVAHAADPEAARQEVSDCNERFLAGLGVRADSTGPPAASVDRNDPLGPTNNAAQ